ncbi:MAG: serine/threonine protein kinase [Lachnospiraceae bacterium]|nr:serine/threonine protein kinase [Lachnospiraceae bacterium]
MLEIGSVVDGKYKILNKVGQGGMSVVYLAMNERANKQWAIKEVRKDGKQDFEVVRQGLVAETDILKKLSHPSLPSIIDVIDSEDTFLIVMDYIEGNSLNKALEEYGAQPQEYVIEWGKQLCDVLSYLHSRKPPIIYRDMKPANVMLKPDGTVSLIDFGTAREFKNDRVEDTTCLGTRGYAAPEQFGGQGQTDARTDVYCLGATLYHLVTGHNPSEYPYEMRPIREWNPGLSSGLEQIILKCTKRNPEDRYQNCNELYYALEHYDEMDSSYKKQQKRKLGAFVASSVITLALTGTSVFGYVKENQVRSLNYDNYVQEANTKGTEAEVRDDYKSAISLNPQKETAYLSILDHFLKDEVLTQEEEECLRGILGTTADNGQTNEENFKTNSAGYAKFAYNMAIAYWYSFGSIDENGIITYRSNTEKATTWFNKVNYIQDYNGRGVSNQKEYENATVYGKIGSYQSTLGRGNLAGDAEYSYSQYWTDLITLHNTGMSSQVTALCLDKEILQCIISNATKFKADGVTEAAMVEVIDGMESEMASITPDPGNQERCEGLIEDIKGYCQMARNSVSAAFGQTSVISAPEETGGE